MVPPSDSLGSCVCCIEQRIAVACAALQGIDQLPWHSALLVAAHLHGSTQSLPRIERTTGAGLASARVTHHARRIMQAFAVDA